MGLVHLPTWLVDVYGFHVGKYTSPMDLMGMASTVYPIIWRTWKTVLAVNFHQLKPLKTSNSLLPKNRVFSNVFQEDMFIMFCMVGKNHQHTRLFSRKSKQRPAECNVHGEVTHEGYRIGMLYDLNMFCFLTLAMFD